MAHLAFVNDKTKKEYKVDKFDKEAGTVTLVGEHGVPFTEPFDKDLFQKLGYDLRQVEAS